MTSFVVTSMLLQISASSIHIEVLIPNTSECDYIGARAFKEVIWLKQSH